MQTLLIKLSVPLVKMEAGGGGVVGAGLKPAGLSEVAGREVYEQADPFLTHPRPWLPLDGQNRIDVLQGTLVGRSGQSQATSWTGCSVVRGWCLGPSTPTPDDAVADRVMESRHHKAFRSGVGR